MSGTADPSGVVGEDIIGVKRSLGMMLFGSCVMLWALSVIMYLHPSHQDAFHVRYTTRGSVSIYQNISDVYALNTDATWNGVDRLKEKSFALGMCFPVSYEGYLEWSGPMVSPLCHCLEKKHDEYATGFVKVGNETHAMTSRDLKANLVGRFDFGERIKRDCFMSTRSTQFEGLAGLSHSPLLTALLWNSVSTASLHSFWFRILPIKAEPPYKVWWGALSLEFLFGVVPVFSGLLGGISLQGVLVIVVVLTYYLFCMVMRAVSKDGNKGLSFGTLYWTQFLLVFPSVFQSANMALQRRDSMLNALIYCVCTAIPLNALAAEFTVHVATHKDSPVTRSGLGQTAMHYSWIANAIMILAMFNLSSPSYPSNPFSSLASYVWAVLAVMCLVPLVQPRSLHGEPSATTKTNLNRHTLDLIARIIFTIAVALDISTTGYADNVVIG